MSTDAVVSLSLDNAAKAADMSRRYLQDAIARGDLVARKAGNKTLVDIEDLRAWVRSLPVIEKAAS